MANLATSSYNNAEWTSIQAGGVLALFNGYELPYKYLPSSKTVKRFGLLCPMEECTAVAGTGGALEAGTYIVTFVEADSEANQGQGLRSGPPLASEGVEVTVGATGTIDITFPAGRRNDDADEYWVYMTINGGAWPTLGRVATVPIDDLTYSIDGTVEPDLEEHPLDPNKREAPAKAYPCKMRQRLLLWGSNEFRTDLALTVGSTEAFVVGGNPLDPGVVGAIVYPDGDGRGYEVTAFNAGSPNSITLSEEFVGTEASQLTSTISCKICHPSGALVWSEPSDYENFPAANIRYVELSAGDPETGCAVVNSVGLLFTVKKTFGLAFSIRPDLGDGNIADLSTTIGCVSHRTIQDIGGMLIWLSRGGFAASTGGAPAIISDEIQSEFASIIRESSGRVRNAFAVNLPDEQRYLCFVPDDGDTVGCSKCIVMDYMTLPGEPKYRFSIYKFDKEFVSAGVERHVDTTSTTNYPEYAVLGDKDGFLWSFGIGDADGPDTGTVSGTVTDAASSPEYLTDTNATFDTNGLGLAGIMVTIKRATDGTEQTKLIGANTADTLYPNEAFDWVPVAGDTYQIGRIEAYYETGFNSLGGDAGTKGLHRLITTHKVETTGNLTQKVYADFSETPIDITNEGATIDLSTSTGRSSTLLSTKRCWYAKVRYENDEPNQPFTLKAANLLADIDEPR